MTDVIAAVHPTKPFANGICFDDIHDMPIRSANVLASRGLVFCTSFRDADKTYGGNVVAGNLKHALRIIASRNLGEVIIGRLIETGNTYGNKVEAISRQEIQAAFDE